jgi:hypothetical protein
MENEKQSVNEEPKKSIPLSPKRYIPYDELGRYIPPGYELER